MEEEFQELLLSYGIKSRLTTAKKTAAQSIVERLHLTIGDKLRMSLYDGDNWKEDVDMLLQACTWAICTTTPSNTPHSPGPFIFGVDVIFFQKVKIDWALLKKQHQDQALANNSKENRTRRTHTYQVGDLILIVDKAYERARTGKLSSPTEGP
ncbi:hypothetical protein ACHAW6_006360, partial [Cyclotella cf. meneghiniana]